MHERALADETIARALEIGALCQEFACVAVVNNPNTKPAPGRKSDEELAVQAESLNRMGRTLSEHRLQLRVHHHTAELVEEAREWRHILRNTDPHYVTLCLDLEHAQHGGMDPNALLREAGSRVSEVHLRNKKGETPTESFGDGDIDHYKIAATIKQLNLQPLVVIELAYHADTPITRSFKEDLRLSRLYAEKVFALWRPASNRISKHVTPCINRDAYSAVAPASERAASKVVFGWADRSPMARKNILSCGAMPCPAAALSGRL